MPDEDEQQLSDRERLELLRLEEADRNRKASDAGNRWLRAVVREARQVGPPSTDEVLAKEAELTAKLGRRPSIREVAASLHASLTTTHRRFAEARKTERRNT